MSQVAIERTALNASVEHLPFNATQRHSTQVRILPRHDRRCFEEHPWLVHCATQLSIRTLPPGLSAQIKLFKEGRSSGRLFEPRVGSAAKAAQQERRQAILPNDAAWATKLSALQVARVISRGATSLTLVVLVTLVVIDAHCP